MLDEPFSLCHVTATKIIPPQCRPTMLSRQRLLNLFNNMLDCKLITVAAPAGYGKTSLLVDVATQLETPVCWYTLDPSDNELQRFFNYLVASIAQRYPDFGEASIKALTSIKSSVNLDYLLSTIINDVYENIDEDFLLVLDDFHHIDNQQILYFFDKFTQMVGENCHLIISSRAVLWLPTLVLLVGRSQAGGIGLKELAFQPDEVQALVLQNYNLSLSEQIALELVQETEGWITGLLLSTQSHWVNMADQLRLARTSGMGVYDYLAQQIFDLQPLAMQEFLLRTSLMDEINAELCSSLFGTPEYAGGQSWHSFIQTVVQKNLFVICLEDKDGTWIRYHNLFRDFLRDKFKKQNPEEVALTLRKLANVYADCGQWEKARDLYLHLSDIPSTIELLERVGSSLLYAGRLLTVLEWINILPEETINSRPSLLSLRGIAEVMAGRVEEGMLFLNQALAILLTTGDVSLLAQTLTRRAVAHKFLPNYEASIADADEALTLVSSNKDLKFVKAEALRAKGLGLYHLGQLNKALNLLHQSLSLYTALNNRQNISVLYLELGIVYKELGLYNKALVCYNHALEYWRQVKNIFWLARLYNSLGKLHHLMGNYALAEKNFEVAIKLAMQSGNTRVEALALTGIGDIYLSLNAPNAALQAYQKAGRHADRFFLSVYLALRKATLARMANDFLQAQELLVSAQTLANSSGSTYEQALCAREVGELELAQKNYQQAADNLNTVVDYFAQGGYRADQIKARLQLAQLCLKLNDRKAAHNHLKKIFLFASRLENRHPLISAAMPCKPLLRAFRNDDAVGYQVNVLLQDIDQYSCKIPILRGKLRRQVSVVPFAPPKLTVTAFGSSRVMLDGQPVTSVDWQTQRRVRELFFYLIANQDGPTRDTIGIVFWPESSPEKLKKQFKNTIYKLRRALDKDFIVFDSWSESYHFNRNLDYEYDVEIFEQYIDHAKAAPIVDEQIEAFTNAINLYQGDYLGEMDGTWILAERERLTQAYKDAILKLTNLQWQSGNFEVVLALCKQALQVDPCQEAVYRQAMRVYAAQGNKADIMRQFQTCKKTLKSELDAPVSAKTLRLYQQLIA